MKTRLTKRPVRTALQVSNPVALQRLYSATDQLLALYLLAHPDAVPSELGVLKLLKWSKAALPPEQTAHYWIQWAGLHHGGPYNTGRVYNQSEHQGTWQGLASTETAAHAWLRLHPKFQGELRLLTVDTDACERVIKSSSINPQPQHTRKHQ